MAPGSPRQPSLGGGIVIVVVGDGPTHAACLVDALTGAGLKPLDPPDAFAEGIYFRTNPRADGTYVFPEPHRASLLAMSPEGLVRSDPAYLDRVLLGVGDWRRAESTAQWLRAIHTVLVDASTRGLPLWTLSVDRPKGEGLGEWLEPLGVSLPVPLSLAIPPPIRGSAPGEKKAASELLDPLHEVLATRGELSEELATRLDDAVQRQP